MTRPYINHGISQIEELFEQSKALPQVLIFIADELKHRKTPRALALDNKVSSLLKGVSLPQGELKLGEQAIKKSDIPIFESTTQKQPNTPIVLMPASSKTDLQFSASSPGVAASRQAIKTNSAEPPMPLADALKILGVKIETPWETVEQARRKVVNLSSPEIMRNVSEEERAVKVQAAVKANHAFRSLVSHRAY